MPLETFVRVDHEEIGGNTDFIRAPTLSEDVAHSRVVVEVSECLVGLPYITLDVIIKLGGCTSKGPEVGFLGLGSCGFSKVVDPLFVKDSLDVDNTISLENLDLLFGDFVFLWGGHSLVDAVGKLDLVILEAEIIFP